MLGAIVARTLKLYALPASHPCAAVEAALVLKAIDFERVDLLPVVPVLIGPLLWGGTTVPGMRENGRRLVGSRTIMRRLDEMVAQPPLLPAPDDPLREKVLEAERWGDEVFQSVPRRLIYAAFLRQPRAMESYAAGAKLPLSPALLRPAMPLTARLLALKNKSTDETARTDIAELPSQLARIDGWIEEGLIGGEQANAADLQIGATIRLLMTIRDLRPLVEDRPARRLVRYFPPLVGSVDAGALPAEWRARKHITSSSRD
jgi:glutathione S-transferase